MADFIGFTGVALALAAFLLNQRGALHQRGLGYPALNLAASVLGGAASIMIDSLPFVVLNATWGVAALVTLTARLARETRSSP